MRKLWVSISGGRTSAYMAIILKRDYSDRYDLRFIYANTGLEDSRTLDFLNLVDNRFNLGVVWVEASINSKKGVATTHTVVDYSTACRDSRIFENMVNAYGIPNSAYPHCTRELKIRPMESYIKSVGWSNEFRAIGIRADEIKRVRDGAGKDRIVYPLVDFFPTDKDDVLDFFEGMPFDLTIPEYRGNCVTCWKKTDSKLIRLISETPEEFDFFNRMEEEKGLRGHNTDGTKRTFFRRHRTVKDLIKIKDLIPAKAAENTDRCSSEECGIE